MSRLAPIYTIYGRLYTTFGLGGRHTGWPNDLPVGSTASARPLQRLNLEQLNFGAVPRTKPSLIDFRDFVGNMYQPIEVSDPKCLCQMDLLKFLASWISRLMPLMVCAKIDQLFLTYYTAISYQLRRVS